MRTISGSKPLEHLYMLSGLPRKFWKDGKYTGTDKKIYLAVQDYLKSFDNFVESGSHLIFCGDNGIGKSFLLAKIARKGIESKMKVRWVRAGVLCQLKSKILTAKMARDYDTVETLRNTWKDILTSKLLFIDDMNRREIMMTNPMIVECLEHTIKYRLDKDKPTFVTTNETRAGFRKFFGENIYSWLSENGTYYNAKGFDARQK